jgi:dTDP-glucose pyrophosphorylase
MVSVIMPMAGLGSRFAAVGEARPKPVISVAGVPMFQVALGSVLAELPDAQTVCVVLDEHRMRGGMADLLSRVDPTVRIAVVPHLTGGALETCLASAPYIADLSAPVIVLDCDIAFMSPPYFDRIRAMHSGLDDSAGLLLSFRSRDPQYSYAEVADGNRVLRAAEKRPISDRALIGAYGFRSAHAFFEVARGIVARNERSGNGEFYVSSAFNQLLAGGGIVRIVDVQQYWSMGTPQALTDCLDDPEFLRYVGQLKTALSRTTS